MIGGWLIMMAAASAVADPWGPVSAPSRVASTNAPRAPEPVEWPRSELPSPDPAAPPLIPESMVAPEYVVAPPAAEPDRSTPLAASWSDTLAFRSTGGDFAVKVGGRVQLDASAFTLGDGPAQAPGNAGLDPEAGDAVNFRRARFRMEGRMYEYQDWAAEFDFVNQLNINNEVFPTDRDSGPGVAVTDLWLQMRELPVLGTLRAGNQKDPFGYEHLTSSRWLNFMERSFNFDAFEGPFNNGFLPGIQTLNNAYDGRVAWYVGQFKNTVNPFGFSSTSGGSMTVGRLVVLPVFENDGEQLVHLGVSGRTMEPQRRQLGYDPLTGEPLGPIVPAVRFRSRGDIRNGPPGPVNSIYADTGILIGSWQNMLGLEFVGNNGPWSWQGEYFGSWLYNARTPSLEQDGFENRPGIAGRQPAPGTEVGTVYYQGGYFEVLYFLTGEHRTYSRIESRFDRPVPRDNFYLVRDPRGSRRPRFSSGAWQLGVRYNYLCLDDGVINGGTLNAFTLGLNWFLSPNSRVYFNYDFTYRDFVNMKNEVGSGSINGFGTRLAFDF
jgi:phosphate-selective porin OprO/OprP